MQGQNQNFICKILVNLNKTVVWREVYEKNFLLRYSRTLILFDWDNDFIALILTLELSK